MHFIFNMQLQFSFLMNPVSPALKQEPFPLIHLPRARYLVLEEQELPGRHSVDSGWGKFEPVCGDVACI